MILAIEVIVQPLAHTIIIRTLLYSLTIEQFLIHLSRTYAAIPYCIIFPILELSVHDDYVCSFEIQCKIAMEFFFGP